MRIQIGQEEFTLDCYAIPLDGFDVILGIQWLGTLGPITWNFSNMTMSFGRLGRCVTWTGLPTSPRSSHALACTGTNLLEELLNDFSDLFSEPHRLPPMREIAHHIHLKKGTDAIAIQPYRYAQMQKDELEHQCTEMLQQGTIRRSSLPFSSSVLLVKKQDGSWRFCVDYHNLNDRTVKDKFLIPVVDELLDELRRAKIFSKLDLRFGYHQVLMHSADIAKTAFRTHQGLFEFLVMPFGLTNAPTTF